MGSTSQFVALLNAKEMPGEREQIINFTHINFTAELKEMRVQYRRVLRRSRRAVQEDLFTGG